MTRPVDIHFMAQSATITGRLVCVLTIVVVMVILRWNTTHNHGPNDRFYWQSGLVLICLYVVRVTSRWEAL